MNGGRVSSLNVLLFRIGNYVAVNYNLCNNLAAWKLKSFCCRPLLFSSLLRACLQCSVISYSCDGTTQLHRLVSVTFNCAYLLIWFSHNVPWDMWISLNVALFFSWYTAFLFHPSQISRAANYLVSMCKLIIKTWHTRLHFDLWRTAKCCAAAAACIWLIWSTLKIYFCLEMSCTSVGLIDWLGSQGIEGTFQANS